MKRNPLSVSGALVVLGVVWGCGGSAGPDAKPPVAKADIEVRLLPSCRPDAESYVSVQTGGAVLLKATGSYDPTGQPLTYEWSDRYLGILSFDFHPNPMVTSNPELGAGLYTLGVHEVTLVVHTRDGRIASHTLRVTVTCCEVCGQCPCSELEPGEMKVPHR